MTGYLWKATVRNVNHAFREINAFEWEGDYRVETANRLKALLEDRRQAGGRPEAGRMEEELELYLY